MNDIFNSVVAKVGPHVDQAFIDARNDPAVRELVGRVKARFNAHSHVADDTAIYEMLATAALAASIRAMLRSAPDDDAMSNDERAKSAEMLRTYAESSLAIQRSAFIATLRLIVPQTLGPKLADASLSKLGDLS